MSCRHERFKAQVNVFKLHEEDNPSNITGHTADITIECLDCGCPMQFIGVPGGVSPVQPMCNFDATELRAPLVPMDKPKVINKNVN